MMMLAVYFVMMLLVWSAVFAVYLRSASPRRAVRTRLQTIHVVERKAEEMGAGELKEAQGKDAASRLSRRLRTTRFGPALERLLLESDSTMTVLSAAAISVGCAVGASLVCFLVMPNPVFVAGCFLLGLASPYAVLKVQRASRLKAFNALLPEALDLMTRALRAGHALGSAIELIGQESPAPLGPEFASLFQQQKLGVRLREAMLEMGARVPSNDLHFVITAILVQRETGGDVTEILERTTHVIRERARIEGEVRTKTAQGRLTVWILGLLPVGMLVMINLVSPGYSHILFHDPLGQKMLYAGAGSMVVGGLVIRKIVDVKV